MKDFEMTQAQLDTLMDACKPQPIMYLDGGKHIPDTPQERVNRAWRVLGRELGFDHMTVKPNGKGDRFFSAECTAHNT